MKLGLYTLSRDAFDSLHNTIKATFQAFSWNSKHTFKYNIVTEISSLYDLNKNRFLLLHQTLDSSCQTIYMSITYFRVEI